MKKLFSYIFILITLGSASTLSVADAHAVRVGGTGSSLQMMTIIAATYQTAYPNRHVQIISGLGSNGGMRALAAGKIQIAISALPLNNEALAVGAVQEEYARTPYTFTAKPSIGLEAITTAEIVAILTGEKKNWPNGQTMRLVMRPLGDSDTLFMRSIAPEIDDAVKVALKRDGIIMAPTDQDSADAIETTSGAFGIITLGQMKAEKRSLKPVKLNGISPSVESLESGEYTYYKSLAIVTNKDADEATQHFANYIRSEAGSSLLKEYGHMVISK